MFVRPPYGNARRHADDNAQHCGGYGKKGIEPIQELEWGEVLGLAATWPQAAGVLPSQEPAFDWQGTKPLRLPREDLIIYEMHVRGFTQSPTSASQHPGAKGSYPLHTPTAAQ